MNIKDQILDCLVDRVKDQYDFSFINLEPDEREFFQQRVNEFFNSKTYDESERRARQLLFFLLDNHGKVPVLAPIIDKMNLDELYGEYEFQGQRLHFLHQVNVYLLGLYFYYNLESLRNKINFEMRKTTVRIIDQERNINFRYSSGTEYGEFLYRWRLTALCHDMGIGIQLCEGKAKCLSDYLTKLRISTSKNTSLLENLWLYEENNLLNELNGIYNKIQFAKSIEFQEASPYPDSVYHDHGIMGALAFLRLIRKEYANHPNLISYKDGYKQLIWHPKILTHSILQIALAIALHNLNENPVALKKTCKQLNVKIYNQSSHPLVWLLKISDLLQEWDKPKAKFFSPKEELPPTTLEIYTDRKSKIMVKGFPENKISKTEEILQTYTTPNIISFIE